MKNLIYCIFISLLIINSTSGCKKGDSDKFEEPAFVPDSALLAKEHPSPLIVRGFQMPETFSQKDCDDARAWGANVIRMQMFPARYATKWNKDFWDAWPSFLDQVEKQIKYAKQAGLKVALELHQPPFQGVANFEQADFWKRKDLEGTFCQVWSEIAKRLLPYKDVIWGYDLLNEPLDRSQLPGVTLQWQPLAIKIIQAIRKVDPDTWIIFEPGPGSLFSGFKGLSPLPDLHIIYSAHFYNPQDFTHQGVFNTAGTDLEHAMEQINIDYPSVINGVPWDKQRLEGVLRDADLFQARWKVPVYVGEFSVIRWAPKDAGVRWLQDVVDLFESRGWSWTYHAFREWHGWSLEHDEKFWMEGMTYPQAVTYETERAKVIRPVLLKNK